MELNVNQFTQYSIFSFQEHLNFFVNHIQCIFFIYSLNSQSLGYWLSTIQQ